MREGWLVSGGEVLASAVEDTSLRRSLTPLGLERRLEVALIARALPVGILGRLRQPLSAGYLSGEGRVLALRVLSSWQLLRRPTGASRLMIVPTAPLERANLGVGDTVEFRAVA